MGVSRCIRDAGGDRRVTRARLVGYAHRWNPVQTPDVRELDLLVFAFAKIHGGHVELTANASRRLQTATALKGRDPALVATHSADGLDIDR